MVLHHGFLLLFDWYFLSSRGLLLRGLGNLADWQFDSVPLAKGAGMFDIPALRNDRTHGRQHGGVVLLLLPPRRLPLAGRFALEHADARPAARTLLGHHVAADAPDVGGNRTVLKQSLFGAES